MSKKDTGFKKGDSVVSEVWGAGVILSVEMVEKSSDDDNTFYRVATENGEVRHLKTGELKASKAS